MTTVAVFGGGQWGTTLAVMLAQQGKSVRHWIREPDVVEAMRSTHENGQFMPGVRLPDSLYATNDMAEAVEGTTLLISTIPSQYVRSVCDDLARTVNVLPPILSVSKGLEIATGKRISEVIHDVLPHAPGVAVLSGPNIAREIALGQPAATVIASTDPALAVLAQQIVLAPRFRPYTSRDVVGVEICGAVKNVIAIAAGICEGLGFGDNAKAALLTRAMAEISRLVCVLGGQAETVAGLAGIGDLITTAFSPLSRNHRVGVAIGRGEDFRTALGESGQVAEGVPTTDAVMRLTHRLGVEMPICEQVYAILFAGKSPAESVTSLMTRELRGEAECLPGY